MTTPDPYERTWRDERPDFEGQSGRAVLWLIWGLSIALAAAVGFIAGWQLRGMGCL